MRIFTGIQLADEAKERIFKELPPFRRAATPMRWTGRETIHLTLKFIGEVGESLAVKAGEALAAARIAVAPFRLRLSGFGKFPAGDDVHVFWAGVEKNQQLDQLFAGVEAALQPLGIEPDTRPFHPHVTLGRNKARSDFRQLFALLGEKSSLFLGEWPVAAFQLFPAAWPPPALFTLS